MKKILYIITITGVFLVSFPLTARKKTKKVVIAPESVEFINTHFQGVTIDKSEIERNTETLEYAVKLDNGDRIVFDEKGEWQEVKAGESGMIPRTLLPDTIYKYIAFKYPQRNIIETKKNSVGYKVELANGVELIFSSTGKFIRKNK
ncbi:MAG: PepSY-like domain-containing protein [Muribaculaceae bacterium]|nr:PepSY-like domain-containing protein [Muribaculaceae bacterium]